MNLAERTARAIEEGQRALIGKSQESPSGKALKACVTLLSEWLREANVAKGAPVEAPMPPIKVETDSGQPVAVHEGRAPKPRKQKGLA